MRQAADADAGPVRARGVTWVGASQAPSSGQCLHDRHGGYGFAEEYDIERVPRSRLYPRGAHPTTPSHGLRILGMQAHCER
jgi:hypothetical protein